MTVTNLLRLLLPYKDIGWAEIGEEFTRFTLLRTPWGNCYLHRLYCPQEHPHCHDHPWSFVTLLLRGGYRELFNDTWTWHSAGTVLYRPAESRHSIVTEGVSWSLVLVAQKRREWGFVNSCSREKS